ncbi:type II toxin-antitoxin system RelE/ParE family toxin [Mucilaginibacter sp. ZT4R22]|uniref:Type II toxin-antitoxin system RelE/ParE family toxin n=1 Tax=Mucilaginibacter pankratovii TaxID=2772110 RepID=A0ABR7WZL8_9SPHI|nr:type II toxin-antitoxin system RelE/ParE family toxin [Mucilaginibacter pankratovii]
MNRPDVRADIKNAVDYYKEISPKLGKQFLHRIREAKIHIERTPLGFQVKYKTVRTLMLKQFPFHIHYLVDKEKKQIIILAIIHAHKNPADYSSR